MPEIPEKYPLLELIVRHHEGITEAVSEYFAMLKDGNAATWPEWMDVGDTPAELDSVRDDLLTEEGLRTCFALVEYIEATFKAHFLYVINEGKQSPLFNSFQCIYSKRSKIKRVSFKGELLEEWRNSGEMEQDFYDKIDKAFNFRNWFAHGRFFKLNLNPAESALYEYNTLRLLAQDVKALCAEASTYLS